MKYTEYVKLYVGAKYLVIFSDGQAYVDFISMVGDDGAIFGKNGCEGANFIDVVVKSKTIVKLVLTHPNEMTKHQMDEYNERCVKNSYGNYLVKFDTPVSIKYLLDNHIDTFDLIEHDIAITETMLSKMRYKTVDYFADQVIEKIREPEAVNIIERKPPKRKSIGIITIDEEYENAANAERLNIQESGKTLSAKDFKEIF